MTTHLHKFWPAVLGSILGLIIGYVVAEQTIFAPTSDELASNIVYLVEHTEKESAVAVAEGEYPVIANKEVSNHLKNYTEHTIDTFLNEVTTFPAEGGRKNSITVTVEDAYITTDLASFLFLISVFTGGSHNNYNSVGINYDLETGELIELSSLFREDAPYLEMIAEKVVEELEPRFGTYERFAEGSAPLPHNYNSFTLTNDTITFHFPPFQLGPFTAGVQSLTFPMTDFAEFLVD